MPKRRFPKDDQIRRGVWFWYSPQLDCELDVDYYYYYFYCNRRKWKMSPKFVKEENYVFFWKKKGWKNVQERPNEESEIKDQSPMKKNISKLNRDSSKVERCGGFSLGSKRQSDACKGGCYRSFRNKAIRIWSQDFLKTKLKFLYPPSGPQRIQNWLANLKCWHEFLTWSKYIWWTCIEKNCER